MDGALNLACSEAQRAGAQRVLSLRLRIGTLSGVVPEALHFAFDALAQGTIAEGAAMLIEPVPARFWCAACLREFEAVEYLSACPVCDAVSTDLRTGREMELASVEIE